MRLRIQFDYLALLSSLKGELKYLLLATYNTMSAVKIPKNPIIKIGDCGKS